MTKLCSILVVAVATLSSASVASAQHGHVGPAYCGPSYCGSSYCQGYNQTYYGSHSSGYRAYSRYARPTWHDTSHYDYHPGSYQPHGNHYDYVPGHYDLHSTGHMHW
jgi:hypothetical protein